MISSNYQAAFAANKAAADIFTPEQQLNDVDSRGRQRDWKGKKVRNELLAMAYDNVDKSKAQRLRDCGKCLTYKVYGDGTRELHSMESCRVRLCPICTWRRSLKVFHQTAEIVEFLGHELDYCYVLLTLTVRSCKGEELADNIDNMMAAWNRFLGLKAIDKVCKGWYRSLEITHDIYPFITHDMYWGNSDRHIKCRKAYYDSHDLKVGDENPAYNTYHPHFHVLICVNKSYFTGRDYLSQAAWAQMWQQAARLDYAPRVDVRRVKGNTVADLNKAVCEVAKYAAKDADYIVPDDWDLTVETVRILDRALANRRLVAYGGKLREVKQMLKQDDEENGNLIDVGDSDGKHDKSEEYRLVSYYWYSGYRQYYEID